MAKAFIAAVHVEGTEAEIRSAMVEFLATLPTGDGVTTSTLEVTQKKTADPGDASACSSSEPLVMSNWPPSRERVLRHLQQHGKPLRVAEIQAAIGLSQPPISKALNSLAANNLARNIRRGKHSLWEAVVK